MRLWLVALIAGVLFGTAAPAVARAESQIGPVQEFLGVPNPDRVGETVVRVGPGWVWVAAPQQTEQDNAIVVRHGSFSPTVQIGDLSGKPISTEGLCYRQRFFGHKRKPNWVTCPSIGWMPNIGRWLPLGGGSVAKLLTLAPVTPAPWSIVRLDLGPGDDRAKIDPQCPEHCFWNNLSDTTNISAVQVLGGPGNDSFKGSPADVNVLYGYGPSGIAGVAVNPYESSWGQYAYPGRSDRDIVRQIGGDLGFMMLGPDADHGYGGSGRNCIYGQGGPDAIDAGSGNDGGEIVPGGQYELIDGIGLNHMRDEMDAYFGATWFDYMFGWLNTCRVSGGDGEDQIHLGIGEDIADSDHGADAIYAREKDLGETLPDQRDQIDCGESQTAGIDDSDKFRVDELDVVRDCESPVFANPFARDALGNFLLRLPPPLETLEIPPGLDAP